MSFEEDFSFKDLSLLDFEELLAKGNFSSLLEKLVEKSLLPKEYLSPLSKKIPEETGEQALEPITEQYKSKVFVERTEYRLDKQGHNQLIHSPAPHHLMPQSIEFLSKKESVFAISHLPFERIAHIFNLLPQDKDVAVASRVCRE